jgi:hypothetical protein
MPRRPKSSPGCTRLSRSLPEVWASSFLVRSARTPPRSPVVPLSYGYSVLAVIQYSRRNRGKGERSWGTTNRLRRARQHHRRTRSSRAGPTRGASLSHLLRRSTRSSRAVPTRTTKLLRRRKRLRRPPKIEGRNLQRSDQAVGGRIGCCPPMLFAMAWCGLTVSKLPENFIDTGTGMCDCCPCLGGRFGASRAGCVKPYLFVITHSPTVQSALVNRE